MGEFSRISAVILSGEYTMSVNGKITEIADLSVRLNSARQSGKKIVHCHGVFDLVHVGHIRHFTQAKKLGDLLVVTLTADEFVNKGPHRPAFNQSLRAEMIAALECVDLVAINHDPSAVPAIRVICPDLHVKGSDYRDRQKDENSKLKAEEQAVIAGGGELVFTDDLQFSSTSLINTHLSQFPENVETYLRELREKEMLNEVRNILSRFKGLKVLVVGEAILDEYRYCEAIGKAGKEPVLVASYKSNEEFAGGTLAIANHIAGFADTVGLLTYLGATNSREDFIRERLRPNVVANFLYSEDRPTIAKLRYVENYLLQKLFEVYTMNDAPLNPREEEQFCNVLKSEVEKYDVVVVADYGHGMISDQAVKVLCAHAKFLAVNTQANAGNRGFHTISRYPRADYVSLSHLELGLEMRLRDGDAQEMIKTVLTRMDCPIFTVTRGRHGIITYDRRSGFAQGPGLTQHIVDRVGSGDAVLSVTSMAAALGASAEVIAFLGNVAGSEAVKIVGHRSFLEAKSLERHVDSLLK